MRAYYISMNVPGKFVAIHGSFILVNIKMDVLV
jgi:hypothetical protein